LLFCKRGVLSTYETKNVIEVIYTLFLGLLLALFVGIGVNTYFPTPEYPEYPSELNYVDSGKLTAEQEKAQAEFDKKNKEYQEDYETHGSYSAAMILAASVVLLSASLLFEKRIKFIADGVLLGGLFTLVYSVGLSFASGEKNLQFLIITIGLLAVLFLGYHRFVKPEKPPKKKRK